MVVVINLANSDLYNISKSYLARENQAAATAAAAAALLTAWRNFNRTESSAEQRAFGTVSRYVTLCCCPHTRRNCSSDLASQSLKCLLCSCILNRPIIPNYYRYSIGNKSFQRRVHRDTLQRQQEQRYQRLLRVDNGIRVPRAWLILAGQEEQQSIKFRTAPSSTGVLFGYVKRSKCADCFIKISSVQNCVRGEGERERERYGKN